MEKEKNRQDKRLWAAAAILLAALGLLFGSWGLHQRKTVLRLDRLAEYLLRSPVYSEGMQALEENEILSRYPGIMWEDFTSCCVYAAGDGTAREFALFQAKDIQAAENMMTALSLYCHECEKLLQLSDPQEQQRMRGYQIRRTRTYVLLVVSDPQGTGGQLLTDFFRQSGYDWRN